MDTNALMMPVELDVRVFDELDRLLGGVDGALDLVTPRAVVDELEILAGVDESGGVAGGHGEEATAASVGLDLVERCEVVGTDAEYADDAVVELAAECDYAVTNDAPLRDRLLARDVPVIGLRGRSQLGITEP